MTRLRFKDLMIHVVQILLSQVQNLCIKESERKTGDYGCEAIIIWVMMLYMIYF